MNILLILMIIIIFILLFWIVNKWKKRVILITHSGDYHLDDVFSTAVLSMRAKKEGKFFQVIRTRNEDTIAKWRELRQLKNKEVYIYDVGGFYEEHKNEFDHHQKGGAGLKANNIEYSSAGLIWKKFGLEMAGSERAFNIIDNEFVSPIDALDNGQEIYNLLYDFRTFDLGDLIKMFSPKRKTNLRVKIAFCRSVKLVEFILKQKIRRELKNQQDIEKLKEIYRNTNDKRVLIVEENGLNTHLVTELSPEILFVIQKKKDDLWYLQTVRIKKGGFERRKYFPDNWAGLNNYDLDQATNVIGGIFCHRAKFVASAKTKEAAIKMIEVALSTE